MSKAGAPATSEGDTDEEQTSSGEDAGRANRGSDASGGSSKTDREQVSSDENADPANLGSDGSGGSGSSSKTDEDDDAQDSDAPSSDSRRSEQSASDGGAATPPPSSPNGGAAAMPTPPDPEIMFDWPEAQASADDCQPGTYSGMFTCEFSWPDDPATDRLPLEGPIVITLVKSQDGEFLEITDGHLDGIAALVFTFQFALSGRLDCGTKKLEAMATEGVAGILDPNALPVTAAEGTLTGTLDPDTGTLSGTWKLSAVAGAGAGGTCVGPWTASFSP